LIERLRFTRLFWRWCSSYRDSRFLFLAGSGARTAQFHTFPDSDRDHFAMFTSHAAALLSNSLLVADVHRERTELETANRGLDLSLNELKETQQRLVESTQMVAMASRQAGMAEIATGILHNVGNVLNSVNVCGDVALQHANGLPIDGLRRLADLLAQQQDLGHFFTHDPRAQKGVVYLQRSLLRIGDEQARIVSELTQLKQHLVHVGAIVSRQQMYAKHSALERCSLSEVMDDALLLARSSHHKGSVNVVRMLDPEPEAEIDRHRVLQILVNLISNALQALAESPRSDKQLIARVSAYGEGKCHLCIEDNGIGIAAEDAPRLFQHGFTTRRDGHGFGLHTSVLTAKELGGQLTFSSPGRGAGATFTLELPLRPDLSRHDAVAPWQSEQHATPQANASNHVQSAS
jgi:signal transduction histidine kinase